MFGLIGHDTWVAGVSNTENSSWSWRELQGAFQQAWGGTNSHSHQGETEKMEGSARKEKVALRLPILKFCEEGSEKGLEEAQITQLTTREAGFQRIAENEDP